jgi:hypothetical protein
MRVRASNSPVNIDAASFVWAGDRPTAADGERATKGSNVTHCAHSTADSG